MDRNLLWRRISKDIKTVESLFDNAVLNRLGKNFSKTPRWKNIQYKFKKAVLLEIDFWEMALE